MDQLVTVLLGRAKHEAKAVPAVVLTEGWHWVVPAVRLERLTDLCCPCPSLCLISGTGRVVKGKRDRRAAGLSVGHATLTTLAS